MAVVINDFEVLPAAAPPRREEAGESGGETGSKDKDKIEPCAVASAMRSLDVQALRVWAH